MSALFFLSTAGFAQWSFDVRAGVNAATFDAGNTRSALGPKAGMGAGYAFSELFEVRSGLFFSMKGASMEGARRFEYDGDKIYRSSYLEIPLRVSFRFGLSPNFRLALNAGPYAAYRIGGKKNGLTDVKDFDAGLGAGLDFLIGKHWLAGVEGQYGLMKVGKLENKNLNNISYSLLLGYRF